MASLVRLVVPLLLAAVFTTPLQAGSSSSSDDQSSAPNQKTAQFSKVASAVFSSSLLSEVTARSKLHCGRKCASDSSCLTFTFIEGARSENYRLHGALLTEVDNHTITEGATSYSDTAALYIFELCSGHAGYLLVTGGYCVKPYELGKDFGGAEWTCSQDGAHLFHVKTEKDAEVLHNITVEYGLEVRVWVGADDKQKEGQFFWSDGTPLPTSSVVWGPGQPASWRQDVDCVGFYATTGRIYDYTSARTFACQLD